MIDAIIKELIVLQVIYSLVVPKVEEGNSKDSRSSGNNSFFDGNNNILPINNNNNNNSSSSNGVNINSGNNNIHHYIYNNFDNKIISSNIKLSLVKITNEIQNSLLINKLMDINNEPKLTIKDILNVIKELFPLQRIILIDGQLSFHNLKIKDLKHLMGLKYDEYKDNQIRFINELDNQILQLSPMNNGTNVLNTNYSIDNIKYKNQNMNNNTNTTISNSNPRSPNNPSKVILQKPQTTSNSYKTTPIFNKSTSSRTSSNSNNSNSAQVVNKDPRREKLLQLYRDTVLNKLQSKSKILDKLYASLNPNECNKVVYHLLELEKIKTTTPASVHNLQLILQKSATDGIMSSLTGSVTWQIGSQVQTELNDTVQFMRRALE